MREKLHHKWKQTPDRVRRPLVLIIGIVIILLSGSIGWLPGPGGIPLFLLGIAILASEYHWAHRLKVYILDIVYSTGRWMRENRAISVVIIILGALCSAYIMYMLLYRR